MLDVLDKKGSSVYVDKGLMKANKGELLFLRSYANFQLWNLFGTAPLVTVRTSESADIYPSNSKDTELLDQCIKDLNEAAILLQGYTPAKWGPSDLGRVTEGAAYALLGKVYLFRRL